MLPMKECTRALSFVHCIDLHMLTFLAIGNWGRRAHRHQVDVASGLARAAREYQADFVVTTGDNFCDDGVDGVLDPQWHDSFDAVYDDAALDIPWYASLGDRDHRGDAGALVEYTQHDLRWRMSDQFYAINKRVDDSTHAQFVFLDTTPLSADRDLAPADDASLQLYWLRNMLAPSRSDWKIVIGHHALADLRLPDNTTAIAPVLQNFGVQAYLSGFKPGLGVRRTDGVCSVLSGAGGGEGAQAPLDDTASFYRAMPGFSVVTLASKTLTIRFCDADGNVIHQEAVELAPHRKAA